SPAGALLMETAGSTTHFVAGSPGTYTVSLVATGSNGISSAPATQTVTVAPCGSHAPYVASVDVAPGSRPAVATPVTVTAHPADADNAPPACSDSIASVDWTLVSAPTGSTLTAPASDPSFAFTFTPDLTGAYVFAAVATDSHGLVSAPFTVRVDTAQCVPNP